MEIRPHKRPTSVRRLDIARSRQDSFEVHVETPRLSAASGAFPRPPFLLPYNPAREGVRPPTEALPRSIAWAAAGAAAAWQLIAATGTVVFVCCHVSRSLTPSQCLVTGRQPEAVVSIEFSTRAACSGWPIFGRLHGWIVVNHCWKGALFWECTPTENRSIGHLHAAQHLVEQDGRRDP
jgi:hypothetical protein